jgi:branched-chain amino acid transport system permease protein
MGSLRNPVFYFGAAALLLASLPLVTSATLNDYLFRIFILVMLAISWNLMAGAGLISLGHSAFMGLGSYVAILLTNNAAAPLPIALAVSILAGAAAGSGLAFLTGSLRGKYFGICTLALSEAMRVAALMLPEFTGGGEGVYLNPQKFPGYPLLIAVAAVGAVVCTFLAYAISRSRFQYALRAMRNNENATMMLGVNPLVFRIGIVTISGGMASLAGGLNIFYGGFLDPGTAFDLNFTILSQVAPLLGGLYTLPGPIIGAIATISLVDLTRLSFGDVKGLSLLIFGIVLVLSILFMPNGIWGTWTRLRRRYGYRGLPGDATETIVKP